MANNNYNYYLDNSFPEEDRRNVAFQEICAVRESLTLARNGLIPEPYESVFAYIRSINPDFYDAIITLITGKNESGLVKYYKDEAAALSTDEKVITPIELIEMELERVNGILNGATKKFIHLQKKKFELAAAKEYFTPRNMSEHKSIRHDFYLQSRADYFGKPLYENDSYTDFRFSKNKIFRIRLLHPDKEEEILGSDLIYEHFDLKLNRVRFAHMQYKTWNNNILYLTKVKNLQAQMETMESNLCNNDYCTGPPNQGRDFRFPYCSAFLRPTSQLQYPDSKLITTGHHVPICKAKELFKDEKKLTKQNIKEKSIRGHIFEELFNTNLAGSRWIPITELEKFYEERDILSHSNRIRVHAQEVDFETEEEENINRETNE
jgi:hypothetical protein